MNPKKRFSNRVDNYIKYRPSYPPEAIEFIIKEFNINSNSIIADIGSGTGILTKLLIDYPSIIYAIEPNNEMRTAAERLLQHYNSFKSINGSAESTNLENNSLNLIIAAQAFHWFDIPKTKIEFKRILKKDGKVLLLWNNRQTNTPFLKEYDTILKTYANDYNEINHRNITIETLKSFYKNEFVNQITFKNVQKFDFEGLLGRLLSSSYSPTPGQDNYDMIKDKLKKLFDLYNENGWINFNYKTELYWGNI